VQERPSGTHLIPDPSEFINQERLAPSDGSTVFQRCFKPPVYLRVIPLRVWPMVIRKINAVRSIIEVHPRLGKETLEARCPWSHPDSVAANALEKRGSGNTHAEKYTRIERVTLARKMGERNSSRAASRIPAPM
jgi:hypothetical protein